MTSPISNNHPITPPPELIEKWRQDILPGYRIGGVNDIAILAARWGADQELEACCEWTAIVGGAEALRAARRPKPPSLKEQALAILDDASNRLDAVHENIIRRALETLPND